MTESLPELAILGTGNMTGAILGGLLASDALPQLPVRVTTKSQESADRFAGDARVAATAGETNANANREAVRGAGVVLLGVKPHLIGGLLDEIRDELAPAAVVISVAAGITTAAIEERLQPGVRVVRAMPNTPAAIGLGVTGIAAGATADDEALSFARRIFEAVGTVVETSEDKIPGIGAVAGSGPAHVYLLIEQMVAATEQLGFTAEQAREMVVATFHGATELVVANPATPLAALRRAVTSPNGTTEQSVAVLQQAELTETFARAFAANIRRSAELAAGQ